MELGGGRFRHRYCSAWCRGKAALGRWLGCLVQLGMPIDAQRSVCVYLRNLSAVLLTKGVCRLVERTCLRRIHGPVVAILKAQLSPGTARCAFQTSRGRVSLWRQT
eukprot:6179651-Pleurochrysis_carterae.AAC.1